MNVQMQGRRAARRPLRLAGWLAVAAVLVLAGCLAYPDSSERLDDDIVYTNGSDQADFGAFRTFAIDPTIHLAKVEADGTIEPGEVDQEDADQMIAQVVKNMTERGYTQVALAEQPQLGISLTAISGLAVGVVSYGYYWGYYGYYWGYPGWGYYYPYNVAYSYRTGTLAIDMVDLASAEGTFPRDGGVPDGDGGVTFDRDAGPGPGALSVLWTAAAYKAGVDAENITSAGVKRAQQAIDQAFKQSPYLRSN